MFFAVYFALKPRRHLKIPAKLRPYACVDGGNASRKADLPAFFKACFNHDIQKCFARREFGDSFGQVIVCRRMRGDYSSHDGYDVTGIKAVELLYRE